MSVLLGLHYPRASVFLLTPFPGNDLFRFEYFPSLLPTLKCCAADQALDLI